MFLSASARGVLICSVEAILRTPRRCIAAYGSQEAMHLSMAVIFLHSKLTILNHVFTRAIKPQSFSFAATVVG